MKSESSGPATSRVSLGELALLFLKLGATAFGGPAAHIAMMEDEVVRRRAWLSREEFLDLLGATNLIPGPNSTEMAIHIGVRKGGWPGLLVAGSCFILPAALLVTVIASVYVRYGALPESAGVLYGVKPVIIAVVLQALWGLGRAGAGRRNDRFAYPGGSICCPSIEHCGEKSARDFTAKTRSAQRERKEWKEWFCGCGFIWYPPAHLKEEALLFKYPGGVVCQSISSRLAIRLRACRGSSKTKLRAGVRP